MRLRILHKACSYLLLVLLFTACIKGTYIDDKILPDVEENTVRVELFTNAEDFQKPVSKADETNTLGTMPWVFVFRGNDSSATLYEVKQAIQGGPSTVPYVGLIKYDSPVQIVIVANAPSQFKHGANVYPFNESNLYAEFNGNTLTYFIDNLKTTNVSMTGIPYNSGYLPMYGTTSLPSIAQGTSIGSSSSKVSLTRIVAKVSVASTISPSVFTINTWTMHNVRNDALFCKDVASGTPVGFNADIASAGSFFYVYTTADTDEPSVIIKATYNGISGQYYRLVFKGDNAGSRLSIQRNNWYQINITNVTNKGFNSPTAAAAAPPSNDITASISIIDPTGYDMQDNGRYFLSSSNSKTLLLGIPSSQYSIATISTNARLADVQAYTGATNTITLSNVSPNNSITLATNSLNLSPDGSVVVATEINCNVNSNFSSATVTVNLGDITHVIGVSSDLIQGSTAATTEVIASSANPIISAVVADSYKTSWLYITPNRFAPYYTVYKPVTGLDRIYLYLEDNTGPVRSGEVFISRHNDGRIKINVSQASRRP